MAKYIQMSQEEIDRGQIKRMREVWTDDVATVSDNGEIVFHNMTDEQYDKAPGWLWADANLPGCVVKER